MAIFDELLHRKGNAEENIYFAKKDRKLIEALHEKQKSEPNQQDDLDDRDDDMV